MIKGLMIGMISVIYGSVLNEMQNDVEQLKLNLIQAIQANAYGGLQRIKSELELHLKRVTRYGVHGTGLISDDKVNSAVNAAIQAIFHSNFFVNWLKQEGIITISDNLLKSLLILYNTLIQRPNIEEDVSAVEVVTKIENAKTQRGISAINHPTDVLRTILSELQSSKLGNLMNFQIQDSHTKQSGVTVMLDLTIFSGNASVTQLLSGYQQPVVNGNGYQKTYKITEYPDLMVLSLNRESDYNRFNNQLINIEQQLTVKESKVVSKTYQLKAVVVWDHTKQKYKTYAVTDSAAAPGESACWYLYDDNIVTYKGTEYSKIKDEIKTNAVIVVYDKI
jgi:Ubiquitin carboxyl-terminal hydrolase